ncbi:MAG TPA: hypothetical protein VGH72_33485 [Pseudonocardia sp.]|jgi:hypothetical protein
MDSFPHGAFTPEVDPYERGQRLANWAIESWTPSMVDSYAQSMRDLFNVAPDLTAESEQFMRGLLDTITEYQHRGDETP